MAQIAGWSQLCTESLCVLERRNAVQLTAALLLGAVAPLLPCLASSRGAVQQALKQSA
jgi:hypothetical protein